MPDRNVRTSRVSPTNKPVPNQGSASAHDPQDLFEPPALDAPPPLLTGAPVPIGGAEDPSRYGVGVGLSAVIAASSIGARAALSMSDLVGHNGQVSAIRVRLRPVLRTWQRASRPQPTRKRGTRRSGSHQAPPNQGIEPGLRPLASDCDSGRFHIYATALVGVPIRPQLRAG
jgi:hypothetical protein